jgi:UDP-N-acetylmuramyl pentapeptide phosphotransferase/UDP-N-acetylglucosamine-1-phosphate transferase
MTAPGASTSRGCARLVAPNHRGVRVPRTLGLAIVAGAVVSTVAVAAVRELSSQAWAALVAIGLIGAAGLIDDLTPAGPRGLRGHVRGLAEGRVSTGILKVVVILGASIVVVALGRTGSALERVAAVVVLAACSNVWNGLDVRPGRAIKAFLPVGVAGVLLVPLDSAPAVLGVLVTAVVVLPLDLRERAMLGDAGSNAIGFTAGLALVALLDGAWLVVAASIAVVLNLVAETVTFSRAIAATPPLRWLDRLGRVH